VEAAMTYNLGRSLAVLLSCALLACSAAGEGNRESGAKDATNADAAVLQDFNSRIKEYLELRNDLKKDAPPLKETKEPAKIAESQDVFAEQIRLARKDARSGDIFTPEVRQLFRRLMYPELKGPDAEATREAIREDAPDKAIPLKVNASYPDSQPLPTMPPNLLASLPKLPEELEYRVIGRTLILRDVHANLIVDYMPNAIR
jgi:hypothetical protein